VMRQTLFRIALDQPWAFWTPDPKTGLPLVGICILLAIGGLLWTIVAWWNDGRRWTKDRTQFAALMAVVIGVLSIPGVTARIPISSVPVFGYGFLLLVGFLSALAFARRQARLSGLDP